MNETYKGKRVLVTGHTGFKGAWLSAWLCKMGAEVVGFSLDEDNSEVYTKANLNAKLFADLRGDVRELDALEKVYEEFKPEIVFHLAAQALVRLSYDWPVDTFASNTMGTVNVLECVRKFNSKGVFITTDKCYKDKQKVEGYTEEDELGGHDPYAASKACAEIVIDSYRKSFNLNAASVRAGNVIGGGDFAKDRLMTDSINFLKQGKNIPVRNPVHVRPWQHVLEPLYGYLVVGEMMLKGENVSEGWNFGPRKESQINVGKLATMIVEGWGSGAWEDLSNPNEVKHETVLLLLDSSKAKSRTKWKPVLDIKDTVKWTVEWYRNATEENGYSLCCEQIDKYLEKQNV
jgi:CDP-glucose 4,6-dehydratase